MNDLSLYLSCLWVFLPIVVLMLSALQSLGLRGTLWGISVHSECEANCSMILFGVTLIGIKLHCRMGADLCELQAKLEDAKGAHLLNTDRLTYTERMLKERMPEMQATLLEQKRKLTFQKERLAKLKVSYQHNLHSAVQQLPVNLFCFL